MITHRMSWCLSFLLHITLLLSLFSVTTKTGQAELEKVFFVSLDTVEPATNIALPQNPVLKKKEAPDLPKKTGSVAPGIKQTPEPMAAKTTTSVFQPEKEKTVVSSEIVFLLENQVSVEEKETTGVPGQNKDETVPFSVNLDTNSPSLSMPSFSGINFLNLKPYLVSLRRQILEKVTYPEIARRRGQEGAVKIAFILDQQGRLKEDRVVNSSGFEVLDSAALQSLKKAAPFPSFPSGVKIQKFSFSLTIRYQLK